MAEHKTPILIVGGGPVGLALAIELATRKVPCLLVNDGPTTAAHPQGNTHNSRTMEHYRRLGIADEVRKTGLPLDYPTDVAYFTRINGPEIARLPMPTPRAKTENRPTNPYARLTPEPIHRANQFYVEPVLHKHAQTLPAATLRYGWRLEGFVDEGTHVEAELVEVATGKRETWRADYLVGCDGGLGTVRRTLGIRYEGQAGGDEAFMAGRMQSFYMRSPKMAELARARQAWQSYTMAPDARCAFVAMDGKGDYAGLARLPPGADETKHDPTPLIIAAVGMDVPVQIISIKPWTAGLALVAEKYRVGRVLMAGDAVHLFTPTGGFGMNTGIDDIANLSWKLWAMHEGWGGPGLIESYESERKKIGIRNTSCSRMFQQMVAKVVVKPELEAENAAGAAARAELGSYLGTFCEEFASLGIQLGARYDDSPLIAHDGAAPPVDDPFVYTPSAVPGGRAPHVWLKDGSALFDRFARGFTVLRTGAQPVDASAFLGAAKRKKIPLEIVDCAEPQVADAYGAALILLRPDQHIAWRGARAPDDADKVLARVTGH